LAVISPGGIIFRVVAVLTHGGRRYLFMGVSLTSKLDRIVEEKKGSIPSIERRAGLSLAEFDATYREQRPVILTDACNDWPARKKWTFDFFSQ
jgi:hypothetical protein